MRIDEILDQHEMGIIVEQTTREALKDEKAIRDAYREIHLLALCLETRYFGYLINKRGLLTRDDIIDAKEEIRRILTENRVLQRANVTYRGRNSGRRVLGSLPYTLAKATQVTMGRLVGGLLIWIGAATALTGGVALPIAAIAAGSIMILSSLGVTQRRAVGSLRAAARYVAIAELVANGYDPTGSNYRGKVQERWDRLTKKDVKEIEEDMRRSMDVNSGKLRKRFEKAIGGSIDETFTYVEIDGEKAEYPIAKMFDLESTF